MQNALSNLTGVTCFKPQILTNPHGSEAYYVIGKNSAGLESDSKHRQIVAAVPVVAFQKEPNGTFTKVDARQDWPWQRRFYQLA